MEKTYNFSRSQLVLIFAEWDRRVLENPDAFLADGEPKDPAVSADYFVSVADDLFTEATAAEELGG